MSAHTAPSKTGNVQFTHIFAVPGSLTIIDAVNPLNGCRSIWGNKTLEQVQQEYPGAQIFEFEPWLKQKEESLCAPAPTEITEEQFNDALDVLPPMHWGRQKDSESFQLMEMLSGRVTSAYCRIGQRYFALTVIEKTPHEEIVERCRKAFNLCKSDSIH